MFRLDKYADAIEATGEVCGNEALLSW